MPSNISDWCVAHLRKVPMVPWPKIANFKYWCPKYICFQSVYRMEITRTSSWGLYYRKDALWTQITTNWEQLCGLKIIKSWRFHFSEQKKSTIGQVIWTLLSNYLFPKNIFWAKRSIESLSKVNLMIPFLPKPIWKLSIVFFNVGASFKDYSNPLNIHNKAISHIKFSAIFFKFDLFEGTAKP